MKNIVVFCDGTWQTFDQAQPTNVALLARLTMLGGLQANVPIQAIYYDDGVGVPTGIADELVKIAGGAFGKGLDDKIVDAYRFICLNYEPGSHIFIFGFSRGAYTARSLAGMMSRYWILRRDHLDSITDVMTNYRSNTLTEAELCAFRAMHSWPVPADGIHLIKYVGVWDTVGSLGIPDDLPFAGVVDQKYAFHDLHLSPFIAAARQAVSIDERRKTFSPSLWDNIDELNAAAGKGDESAAPYQQQWFPGGHGSVGGGSADGGISIAPLMWIAQGAESAGLVLDPAMKDQIAANANDLAEFPPNDWTFGALILDAVGMAWRAPGPQTIEQISASAQKRWQEISTYRPEPLRFVLGVG